jgi:hypothetical protein
VSLLEQEIVSYPAGSPREIELLAFAIRDFPLRISKEELSALELEFQAFKPRQASQKAFDDLVNAVHATFAFCNYRLIYWINQAGPLISGENIFASLGYVDFYRAYEDALATARWNQDHSELSGLAKAWLAFETKPVTPLADPPSSRPSE